MQSFHFLIILHSIRKIKWRLTIFLIFQRKPSEEKELKITYYSTVHIQVTYWFFRLFLIFRVCFFLFRVYICVSTMRERVHSKLGIFVNKSLVHHITRAECVGRLLLLLLLLCTFFVFIFIFISFLQLFNYPIRPKSTVLIYW